MLLKTRNKYGYETNPVVMAVIIAVIIVLLSIASYNVLWGFLNHQISKSKAMVWEFIDNITLNAKSGEWIMTDDRNKRNIYILKDGSSTIEVYSYKEVFKETKTNQAYKWVSTPVIKFDRYYTIKLPMETKIVFLENTPLKDENFSEIALQVDAPNADITLFDINDGNFRRFTDSDKLMPGSLDNRWLNGRTQLDGKTYIKEYWRWDVNNNVQYGRILWGCTPPTCASFDSMEIGVSYKDDIIWRLVLDKMTHKIAFLPDGLEPEKYRKNWTPECNNFYRGSCYADNTYYEWKPDSEVKECTFFWGDCYKNGAIMTLPSWETCKWQPWICVVQ